MMLQALGSAGHKTQTHIHTTTHTLTAYPFVPSADHAAHREAHASVTQHHVSQQLGGSSHRDPVVVPQLVEPGWNNIKRSEVGHSLMTILLGL